MCHPQQHRVDQKRQAQKVSAPNSVADFGNVAIGLRRFVKTQKRDRFSYKERTAECGLPCSTLHVIDSCHDVFGTDALHADETLSVLTTTLLAVQPLPVAPDAPVDVYRVLLGCLR